MSTPTDTPEKDKIFDEHVARIMKQTGDGLATILDPNKPATPDAPVAPPSPTPPPPAAPAAPATPAPEPAKPAAAAPVPTPPTVVLRPKTPAPAPETPKPEPAPIVDPFEQSLTEDQKEELALARYAEQHMGKKGLADQYLNYFKKVDEFAKQNPSAELDSEEFTKVINDNRPKWDRGEQRRAEKQMITEHAVAEAKKAAQQVSEPVRMKQREAEIQPEIERTVKLVEDTLTTKDAATPDMEFIDPEVVKALREKGYAQALQEFDVEVPIIQGTIDASTEWAKLTQGAVAFDEKNPTHRWLAEFVTREEQRYLNDPKTTKVIDGRRFVPMYEYLKLQRENPTESEKTWTMPDEMIGHAIINNGKVLYDRTVKHRRQAGWERKAKQKLPDASPPTPTPTPVPTPEPTPTPGSPKGGSRPIPGAATTVTDNNAVFAEMPHLRNVTTGSVTG